MKAAFVISRPVACCYTHGVNRCSVFCLVGVASACATDTRVDTIVYDARFDTGAMDLHAPAEAASTARPAILLIHGGGWFFGNRSEMTAAAERFASAGYVVANIDYRLVPEGRFPAAVQDVFCALAYLRAHADELMIDPSRIAAIGYSAGAHLAAMTGVAAEDPELQDEACPWGRTERVAAVVSGAGAMQLAVLRDVTAREFLGVSYDEDPGRWSQASPISHVGESEPPFLFVHAEHDLVVDLNQSEAMQGALEAAGNQAWLLRLEGGGHVLSDGGGLGYEQLEFALYTLEGWLASMDFLAQTVGRP